MTTLRRHLAFMALGLLAVGCSKTSTSGGDKDNSGTSGIAVPKEISALPTKSSSASSLHAPGTSSLVSELSQALATDTDTDYTNAQTIKFVDERALSQFDVFNTIFNALGQTHYADAENIGKGPYGSMVSWVEEKGDSQQKQLVPWVVDSSMITEGGKDVNRVLIWMRMPMGDGQPHVIKVELKIYEAPVQNADGSYADYGVWRLNAKFDESGNNFFAAAAAHGADGLSVVMLHEKEGPERETRGIMQRSDASGSGRVTFPDWSSCHEPSCQPGAVTVAYVYDAKHVALKKGDAAPIYKDRTSVVDLVNRYGLYDAETGTDVVKSHSFGFPIRFKDEAGIEHFGYYGAWQGRHQMWSDGQQSITAGTTVTRADRPPNQAAETYTVSNSFKGTLVKRTLVAAKVEDIKDLVVETWVNQNYSLQASGGHWFKCEIMQSGQAGPPSCTTPFDDFASFAYNPNDRRRFVSIGYNEPPPPCGQQPCQAPQQPPLPVNLVYCMDATACPNGTSFPDFYLANPPQNGPPTPTGQVWSGPSDGGNMWVNVGGSVYIQYNGTSWVQKKVASFDQDTWTPTFDPVDLPYSLEQGREYYINNPGANYIVKLTDSGAYDVHIELQSVANPVNAGTFVAAETVFKPQWGGTNESTYEFVTDSASAKFLKLVYKTVGDRDQQSNIQPGDEVKNGQWGLHAWSGGADTGVQYNWDYPQEGQNWGSVQYLKSGDTYLILDNPLRFDSIVLTNHAGDQKTYALQFDGNWVNGLPDIYHDLQKNDFVLTAEIADKVVVIPAGTEVVDSDSRKHYLFKPLQMNEYLASISDPGGLDLSTAAALDLQAVPNFVDAGMGEMKDLPPKYSEGKLLQ